MTTSSVIAGARQFYTITYQIWIGIPHEDSWYNTDINNCSEKRLGSFRPPHFLRKGLHGEMIYDSTPRYG